MIKFLLIETGAVPGVAKRAIPKVLKTAWLNAVKYWHSVLRKKHFTTAGAREYRYREPSDKYLLKKLNKKGHDNPLVWSGRGQEATRLGKLNSTKSRGIVRMDARVFNFKPEGYDQPLRAQLLAMSKDDETAIARIVMRSFASGISAIRHRKKKRIK